MSSAMVTRTRDELPPGVRGPVGQLIDLRPLVGVWVNYDEGSTGITRVEINDWEGSPTVRVFGAGPPPTDWGEVVGAAFTDGVGVYEAVAFSASYDLGFVNVFLAGYLNTRLLVVDAYSTFADSSGRASYFQRDHFYLP